MKKTIIGLSAGLFLFGVSQAANAATVNLITNGNFEAGLTGWTISNPSNNPLMVELVDIDGSGPSALSNALKMQTGGGFGTNDINLSQTVSVVAGQEYTLHADLAALGGSQWTNASGGEITARLGATIIDSFNFGEIQPNTWEFATLDATFTAAASGLFDLQIFRPYTNNSTTPWQFIDNISVETNVVPEPSTMLLLGTGILGFAGISRRKK